MGNIFNTDFREFIIALNKAEVKYILVGGYSVILHGHNRTTGDLDIWVEATSNNYEKLVRCFFDFGLPIFEMTEERFLNTNVYDVFTFGTPPVSIDILTLVKGLAFEEVYQNILIKNIEDLEVKLINRSDLIKAKKASGRNKDLDDLENLL